MRSDRMKYKDYTATVYYDEEEGIFVGEISGISDSLNFHGKPADELEEASHDSIEDYLMICRKSGKDPQTSLRKGNA